jgi:hypothetical protein
MKTMNADVMVKGSTSFKRLLCAAMLAISVCGTAWAASDVKAEDEYWALLEREEIANRNFAKEWKELSEGLFQFEKFLTQGGRNSAMKLVARLKQLVELEVFTLEGFFVDYLQWANARSPEMVPLYEERRSCVRPHAVKSVKLTHEITAAIAEIIKHVEQNETDVAVKGGQLQFADRINQIRYARLYTGLVGKVRAFKENQKKFGACLVEKPGTSKI